MERNFVCSLENYWISSSKSWQRKKESLCARAHSLISKIDYYHFCYISFSIWQTKLEHASMVTETKTHRIIYMKTSHGRISPEHIEYSNWLTTKNFCSDAITFSTQNIMRTCFHIKSIMRGIHKKIVVSVNNHKWCNVNNTNYLFSFDR